MINYIDGSVIQMASLRQLSKIQKDLSTWFMVLRVLVVVVKLELRVELYGCGSYLPSHHFLFQKPYVRFCFDGFSEIASPTHFDVRFHEWGLDGLFGSQLLPSFVLVLLIDLKFNFFDLDSIEKQVIGH
ncbi:hypothetical protein BpHYR1_011546 [Brachionus plicatilis]|uniref:Uncharacterized protein n=1 Tax=Brachionus plicatilis TaxID=10195 RepID=A0A3M7QZI1_BRAPC|nr:hypothetical protein BpHYR1_011546 [Brachionus plicatilis]